jgi:hypothetical protein
MVTEPLVLSPVAAKLSQVSSIKGCTFSRWTKAAREKMRSRWQSRLNRTDGHTVKFRKGLDKEEKMKNKEWYN